MINSIRSNTYISQVQTSKVNVKQDFSTQLREKYSCLRNGYCRLSPAYIKKCENDPQKRLELEKTLSFLEQNQKNELKWADAQGVRINSSWTEIDSDGNCTGAISTTRCSDKKFVNSFNTETGVRSAISYPKGTQNNSYSISNKIKGHKKGYMNTNEKIEDALREKKLEEERFWKRRLMERALMERSIKKFES